MTPEMEKRLGEIRRLVCCEHPGECTNHKHRTERDLLAMVDSLRKELKHRQGESPWACCVDTVAERDSLRAQVEGLREELARYKLPERTPDIRLHQTWCKCGYHGQSGDANHHMKPESFFPCSTCGEFPAVVCPKGCVGLPTKTEET
jgi:hypothetical protein